jgi:multicomponent K+:H+ antiporter subunit C
VEVLISVVIGVLIGCGVYLMLRARTFSVALGFTLLSYAINGLVFVMGRVASNAPPIVQEHGAVYADPLPQALVLTAIVIGFGMTAFLVVLALRAYGDLGGDHVDEANDER